MNRRDFLRLASFFVVDPEKLLWIPGEKTIFIPSSGLSYEEIMAAELKIIMPRVKILFDQDNAFFRAIESRNIEKISNHSMCIPLSLKNR